VDEVWILETIAYNTDDIFRFELRRDGKLISDLNFQSGALTSRLESGTRTTT
jgi:hypothetical protein